MNSLFGLLSGFETALSFHALLLCFTGCVLGILVGVLPGIGTATTIAILLPFAYGHDATLLLIMFSGIYLGAQFGGAITSILMNVPGEASSVATTLDGYPLTRQGKAGSALTTAAFSSFTGGLIGLIGLTFFSPLISSYALLFGPPEKFLLVTMALLLFCSIGTSKLALGAMLLGLMLGTIGPDPLRGDPRFDLGLFQLQDGIDFVVLAVGLLGMGEVLASLWEPPVGDSVSPRWRDLLPRFSDLKVVYKTVVRSSLLGFGLGALPGSGTAAASFMAYALEQRVSPHGKEFGTGRLEGVAAPQSAGDAAVAGALLHMLSLGIPGSASTALMLTTLIIAGVQPGPLLMIEHPTLVWGVIASLFIANFMLITLNLSLIPLFARTARLPYVFIFPLIILFAIIGAYSVNADFFQVWTMLVFGVVGFLLKWARIPTAPMVLALVLGPIGETSLVQTYSMSRGNSLIFLERPVSLIMIVGGAAFFALMIGLRVRKRRAAVEGEGVA